MFFTRHVNSAFFKGGAKRDQISPCWRKIHYYRKSAQNRAKGAAISEKKDQKKNFKIEGKICDRRKKACDWRKKSVIGEKSLPSG